MSNKTVGQLWNEAMQRIDEQYRKEELAEVTAELNAWKQRAIDAEKRIDELEARVAELESRRFMLFEGEFYYPCGGMDDLVGCFSSLDDATSGYQKDQEHDVFGWACVYDILSDKIVWQSGCDGGE